MTIERFEHPEIMTLREVTELLKKKKHPILNFIFGDYNNRIDSVVASISVDLTASHFAEKSLFGPKWCMDIGLQWKQLHEVEAAKYWYQVEKIVTSYSDHFVDSFEGLYSQVKYAVWGIVAED